MFTVSHCDPIARRGAVCNRRKPTLQTRNGLLRQIEHPLLEDYILSLEILSFYLLVYELHPWAVLVFS